MMSRVRCEATVGLRSLGISNFPIQSAESSWIRQLTAFPRWQVLAGSGDSGHDRPHQSGDGAAHPIELPSTTLAALRILAMAQAMAAVLALPSRPMTARSGAPNCRI
jgi:hypothetical protein